jgi:hypothetical protein
MMIIDKQFELNRVGSCLQVISVNQHFSNPKIKWLQDVEATS